jgi:hypothetical protein
MVAQLRYLDSVSGNLVDDALFIIYTAGPISGEGMFQGLGLPYSMEGASLDFVYPCIDAVENFFTGLLPIEVILPGMG